MIPHYVPPTYPVLKFVSRAGMAIAVLVGVAVVGIGFWQASVTQQWFWSVAGVLGGIVIGGMLASYVEVTRIVLDTLVPR